MVDYFLVFIAAIAIASAFRVITAKNTVHSVFALILTFFCTAIIWLSLNAEFLAISLVLVYVGAVLVLFLFVVMMLEEERIIELAKHRKEYSFVITLVFFGVLLSAFMSFKYSNINSLVSDYSTFNNIKVLGHILFRDFLFEFEVVGLILLVGIIAAISLTHKGKINRKMQCVSEQVAADPKTRVKLLKMDGSENLIEGN